MYFTASIRAAKSCYSGAERSKKSHLQEIFLLKNTHSIRWRLHMVFDNPLSQFPDLILKYSHLDWLSVTINRCILGKVILPWNPKPINRTTSRYHLWRRGILLYLAITTYLIGSIKTRSQLFDVLAKDLSMSTFSEIWSFWTALVYFETHITYKKVGKNILARLNCTKEYKTLFIQWYWGLRIIKTKVSGQKCIYPSYSVPQKIAHGHINGCVLTNCSANTWKKPWIHQNLYHAIHHKSPSLFLSRSRISDVPGSICTLEHNCVRNLYLAFWPSAYWSRWICSVCIHIQTLFWTTTKLSKNESDSQHDLALQS